jgi:AcrR family transcriptional regulator
MGARKDDRRVQRSQQLLRAALLSLIEEKGFEVLTVQEIIDRANVGCATFYAHFASKEELLVSGLDGLRKNSRNRHAPVVAPTNDSSHSVRRYSHTSLNTERCFGRWWVNRVVP